MDLKVVSDEIRLIWTILPCYREDVGLLDEFETLTKQEIETRARIREQQDILDNIIERKGEIKKMIEESLVNVAGARSLFDQVPLALPSDQPTPGEIETANAVREIGGLVTAEMLGRKLKIPAKAAATRLGRAYARRLIVRTDRGKYRAHDNSNDNDFVQEEFETK